MADEQHEAPEVDQAAHLDEFRAPDLGADDPADDDVISADGDGEFEGEWPPNDGPEIMDREAFWVVFSTAFSLPGTLVTEFKPLAIAEGEQEQGRAAADAVYSLLEIYYPKALMPMGETMAHVLTAAPFFLAKAMVVRSILEARRNPPPRDVTPRDQGGDQDNAEGDQEPQFRSRRAGPMDWADAEGQG
jgi:hypothetical protein